MQATQADVTWDTRTKQWLVRVHIGEEVIRRHLKSPKDADEQTLRTLAVQTAEEEGYQLDPARVSVGA